jgi:RNA polymerase sigma-70 factor (ECF subfamily)
MLLRYEEELEIDEIATKMDSTPSAIYRSLSRLRLSLLDCISSRIKSETIIP